MNNSANASKKLNTDLIGGLMVLAVAAFFQWNMDPDFSSLAAYFPQRIIAFLGILGVLLLVKAKVKPVYMDNFFSQMNSCMVFTIVVGLAWVLLLEWIGFLISSLGAIFAILYRLEPAANRTPARLVKLAAIAMGEVAVIYVVFVKLLYVTMPVGRLLG